MEEQKNGIGALAGTIIVVIILIIGGFYFYGQRIEKQKQNQASVTEASSSDKINDIKKDLDALNFDNL
jgi:preprotein translocase subunit YajC